MNRPVIIVASTKGHASSVSDLANFLKNSKLTIPYILNFPGDIRSEGFYAFDQYVIDEIGVTRKERPVVDFSARQIIKRLPMLFFLRVAIVKFLRPIINGLCSLYFYTTLAKNFILLADFSASGFRYAVVKTLTRIRELRNIFPNYSNAMYRKIMRNIDAVAFWGIWNTVRCKNSFRSFLKDSRVSAIIIPGLDWGYMHAVLVRASADAAVPIIIIPTFMGGRDGYLTGLAGSPDIKINTIFKFILAKAFPEWTSSDGPSKVMLPKSWLLSCIVSDILPVDPWVSNPSGYGRVAVDNFLTRAFYKAEGVDVTDWDVVGSIAEDRLYCIKNNAASVRASLAGKYKLDQSKKWLLLALPPDQYPSVVADDLQYENYVMLMDGLILDTLAVSDRFEILVSIHPRGTTEHANFVKARGLTVISDRIEDILAVTDIYVAAESATIRWAQAAGVPVINYDIYNYKGKDYDGSKGIVTVRKSAEYVDLLCNIKNNSQFMAFLSDSQASESKKNFIFDGKGAKRLEKIIKETSGLSH